MDACRARVLLWEIPMMTKLSTNLTHQPANLTDVSPEDRVTYRKWAYGWFIAYSVLLGAMVVYSLVSRPEPRILQADRNIGAELIVNSTAIPARSKTERSK
jgi:hypothetical protein